MDYGFQYFPKPFMGVDCFDCRFVAKPFWTGLLVMSTLYVATYVTMYTQPGSQAVWQILTLPYVWNLSALSSINKQESV